MKKTEALLDVKNVLSTYKTPPGKIQQYTHLLPLQKNSELASECAYLIGKVMGDGNLDPTFTLRFIGKKEDLKLLQSLIMKKFRLNSTRFSLKKRINKGVSYLLQVNCAFLGRVLYLLGAPIGNKTKSAFKLPNWILTNNAHKRRFLQAILEDELTTIKIEKCSYSVKPRLKLAKKEELINNLREFMQRVKEAIESFGIECNHISKPIHSIKTKELYFHINRNKKNILKFREQIGFRLNQDKVQKLDNCCRVLKDSIKTTTDS